MGKKRKLLLSDQLRNAVIAAGEAGKSRYRIAQECGIGEAAISRFVNGKGGLSLQAIDAIGSCLGLELVQKSTPTKGEIMTNKSENASAKRARLTSYLQAHPDQRFRAVELLQAAGVSYPKRMLRSLMKGHASIRRERGYWWYQAKET